MKTPDASHPISLEPGPGRVTVYFAGRAIASSRQALTLREASLAPVYYLPLADVAGEVLEPSAHHSDCPYKGQARYWHLVAAGQRADNAVWGYPEPYPAVAAIRDRVAFYPARVERIEVADD